MPYTPDNLTIDPWSSPVTISGTDLIRNLDEAVNTIISTDANSIKNHVNTQLDKIPPYLSSEFNKIYTGVETNAVIATTKATEASASATTATNQATIATTKAGEASASATSASNSATTATTKASEASASATSASNSATSASNSATTATTKANEASSSATDAYNAQLAAEAVFDNFDDKYLGAKATAPTVDNDGNPLVTGALYFRTTAPKGIYVYDAELSAWSIFSYIPTSHGTLSGRSDADSHPMSAITGLFPALADKAPINSPSFTGIPLVTTAGINTNNTQIANTAHVFEAKGNLKEQLAISTSKTLTQNMGGALIVTIAGGVTITMPAPYSVVSGTTFYINAGYDTTIALNGNATNLASTTIKAGQTVVLQSDGGYFYRVINRFKELASSLNPGAGYAYLENGLLMQWGSGIGINIPANMGALDITFPITFPNDVFYSDVAVVSTSVNNQIYTPFCCATTTSNLHITNNDPDSAITQIRWVSIGY